VLIFLKSCAVRYSEGSLWSQTHHCHQKKPDELPDIYRLKRRQHNPWKATQERNSAAKF